MTATQTIADGTQRYPEPGLPSRASPQSPGPPEETRNSISCYSKSLDFGVFVKKQINMNTEVLLKVKVTQWGNNGNSERLFFLGSKNHCGW